jgi:tripartite-type tricarboxylate transporter receptor subunit TctC
MHHPSDTSEANLHQQKRRQLMAAGLLVFAGPSFAQLGKKVASIIVPFAPGGAREMPARLIQQDLNKETGLSWIIESKPGAGGAIGTSFVAKAAPDGQTLLMAASSHFVTAALGAKPAYDPVAEFTPVALIGVQSYVMIVQAALPIKNVAELIAYAKKNPGVLNYNSAGVASSTHLAGAYFANAAGIQLTHIPFKGTQEAANDVMGERGHIVFVPTAGLGIYLTDKRVRVLASTATKRSPVIPNIPTMAESGLPNFQFESWFGLLAPAKTPPDIVAKLNTAVNKAIAVPEVQERLEGIGIRTNPMTAAEFNKIFLNDKLLMAKIVKESGITRE